MNTNFVGKEHGCFRSCSERCNCLGVLCCIECGYHDGEENEALHSKTIHDQVQNLDDFYHFIFNAKFGEKGEMKDSLGGMVKFNRCFQQTYDDTQRKHYYIRGLDYRRTMNHNCNGCYPGASPLCKDAIINWFAPYNDDSEDSDDDSQDSSTDDEPEDKSVPDIHESNIVKFMKQNIDRHCDGNTTRVVLPTEDPCGTSYSNFYFQKIRKNNTRNDVWSLYVELIVDWQRTHTSSHQFGQAPPPPLSPVEFLRHYLMGELVPRTKSNYINVGSFSKNMSLIRSFVGIGSNANSNDSSKQRASDVHTVIAHHQFKYGLPGVSANAYNGEIMLIKGLSFGTIRDKSDEPIHVIHDNDVFVFEVPEEVMKILRNYHRKEVDTLPKNGDMFGECEFAPYSPGLMTCPSVVSDFETSAPEQDGFTRLMAGTKYADEINKMEHDTNMEIVTEKLKELAKSHFEIDGWECQPDRFCIQATFAQSRVDPNLAYSSMPHRFFRQNTLLFHMGAHFDKVKACTIIIPIGEHGLFSRIFHDVNDTNGSILYTASGSGTISPSTVTHEIGHATELEGNPAFIFTVVAQKKSENLMLDGHLRALCRREYPNFTDSVEMCSGGQIDQKREARMVLIHQRLYSKPRQEPNKLMGAITAQMGRDERNSQNLSSFKDTNWTTLNKNLVDIYENIGSGENGVGGKTESTRVSKKNKKKKKKKKKDDKNKKRSNESNSGSSQDRGKKTRKRKKNGK